VVITSDSATVADPAYAGYVTEIQTTLAGTNAVTAVGSYLTEDGPVSEAGNTALLPVGVG
jgi:hypothetical protein